ncbi:MAG: hypothetical protein AAB288_14490, partial [Acidobacteriota bacterium]
MMRPILAMILLAVSAAFPQSGRVKPPDNPAPASKPSTKLPIQYNPTRVPDEPGALPTPTPKASDDDVIKVESTLVPIPVSVLDSNGRSLTTLTLEDFELKINGTQAELSELSRSETPIRLVMLFDNSSSVMIAREFEKKAAIKFFDRMIRPEKDLAALFRRLDAARLRERGRHCKQ